MAEDKVIRTTTLDDRRKKIRKQGPFMDGRALVTFVAIFALLSPLFAQSNQNPAISPTPLASASGFVLQDGTPVKLRTNRTLSSADARTGDQVDFEVLEEVRLNGALVIAKGGTAIGTVTQAEAKRRMGRGGKLDITIDSVRLVDSEKAALRAVKESKGGGHAGAMAAGMVATSLVIWPAAPFFLLMHGKDITIPKDTEITAYINGDMTLDAAKFQPASLVPGTVATATAAHTQNSTLQITSVPSGADIELDGNFVGNTPSQLDVTAGDHTIRLTKIGFLPWEKKVHTTAGNVTVNAEIEQQPKVARLSH
jgi:hypothetical protein